MGSQFSPQALHNFADRLLVSAIPPPLSLLGGLDQSCLRQDRHVVRNRRLRQPNPLFDLSSAKARTMNGPLSPGFSVRSPHF